MRMTFSEYFLTTSNAVGDARVLPDRVFDLAQFDPQSPYLDLVILPAEILDIAVRQPPGDVAGSIDSFAGVDGIVGELFIGQGRVVQIASGQTDAGNAQLSGLADRHLLAVSDDVKPDVVDRPADRNGFEIIVRGAIEIS